MRKRIKLVFFLMLIAVLSDICSIGYCEKYEFEDNYKLSYKNAWVTEESEKYSGAGALKLYTRNDSEVGYYVEYTVKTEESGAYQLSVDSTELGGNVYCDVFVSVNGGELYSLNSNSGVGIPQSSGLTRWTIEHLPGFVAGNNTIRFTVTDSRLRDSLYIAYFDCFSLEKADFGIQNIEIEGDTAYNIVEHGADVSAVFSFSEACSEEKSIKVSLSDYWGKSVSSKEYTAKAGDTSLTANFGALAKGHYTVKAEILGDVIAQEFFAVVTPQNKRIRFSDTPFGVDTAFSIIGPRETIDDNLEALKLSGASWIRERLILSDISKSGSTWNFKGSFSDEVLTKAKNLGLKTHVMIQSMPALLLDSDSKENSELITKNYVGLYDFSKQLAEYYDGRVETFEIFNEPDTNVGSSNSETGDKIANYVKATAIGIKDADTRVGVTAPGYSSVRTEPLELGLRCGMLDFVDISAYHSHQTYNKNYTTQSLKINPTQNFNNLMSAYGYTKKQVWLDEMGISLGSSDSESLGEKEQRSQASYCIMSICEALSKGADKTFSYLFNDKRSRFSWFSRFNEGPNRVYTAFSVMTDVLGEGECLGKVNYFDGVEGYIFKNGHKQILVLRCDTQSSINIPVTAASVEIIKVDGSSAVKYPKGGLISVEVSSDPVFVSISGEYDKALYTARNKGVNDFEVEEKSFSEAERIIVHQTYPSDTRANAKYDGYKVGEETEITVTVTNLNSASKEGIIYGEAFSGWEITPKEQSVRIEENQTATLTFCLVKTEDAIDNQKSAVVFKGKFGDEYTKESVTEIVHTGNIGYEQIRSMPELLLASSWKEEACSGTQTTIKTEEDGISFKFNFSVSALDKWAYPNYEFSEAQDFSGADGILIRYYAEESFADYDKLTCALWLGEKDGGRYITSLGKVLNKGENVWLIPFSEFTHRNGNEIDNILTTDNIDYISFGVNSKGSVLDVPKVTILDVGLYCAEKEAGRYANVSSAEFCRPCEVKSKYGCVKIDFSDAQIDADLDTVKVMVDNKECETCVIDNSLYAVLPFGVKNGDHKVFISYKCYDTKGFYEELNVSSQDFAVWAEENPVVWHTNYSEETDFKYSFEILKDGYYSLYASAGEKDSDEYAKCVFDISGICSFAVDDAEYESAGDGMGYYKFDSIYLKKGEYQLCISKAEGEELKEIALDYTGLIFDYEVVSRVEGEAYQNITFPNSGTAVSGGKTYLYANSPIEQDGESYSITYSVSVPEDGEYTLCAVTAPTDNLYYSPYRFIIDGEVIVNSHYSREAGADVGSLKTYSYGDLYLTEGEHEIQVIVENRRLKGSPLSYYFWMDCIELRTKPDTDSAPYSYVTFNFENLYEDAVLPDVYCKTLNKENRMQHLELIKQKEILPGESVSAKFTVKNIDGGLKNIYIWDSTLKPLTNVIVYE